MPCLLFRAITYPMTDKLGRILFKSGGIVLLFLGAIHIVSLFIKQSPANDTEKQLLDLMTNYKFNLLGSMRSFWDLYQGFSATFSIWALGLGTLDLSLSNERPALLKRLALINILWLAALIALSLHNFFAFPTTFLSIILLIFLAAWLKLPAEPPA
jgi:putative Mn2+ efflux pump MntP